MVLSHLRLELPVLGERNGVGDCGRECLCFPDGPSGGLPIRSLRSPDGPSGGLSDSVAVLPGRGRPGHFPIPEPVLPGRGRPGHFPIPWLCFPDGFVGWTAIQSIQLILSKALLRDLGGLARGNPDPNRPMERDARDLAPPIVLFFPGRDVREASLGLIRSRRAFIPGLCGFASSVGRSCSGRRRGAAHGRRRRPHRGQFRNRH